MKINGIILSFEVEPGESLGALVKECGYSPPETTEQGKVTTKLTYEFSDKVDVERIADAIFITVVTSDLKTFGRAVNEVISDLKKVGLLQ